MRVRIRQIDWLEIALIVSSITLFAQLTPDMLRMWCEWPRPGKQTPGRATLITPAGNTQVQYLVYLPKDYSRRKRSPLLLFLHGAGERGNDVELVKQYGLAALIDKGKHLPLIVVSPQCRLNTGWESVQLLALLDHIEQKFSVDHDRIYLSGFSMGGFGTWNLAAAAPERFAAAVPICGGGNVNQADQLVKLPIWAFHGRHDSVIPLNATTEMVEAIRAKGGNPRLTIYDDQNHGIGELAFSSEELFKWILQQRRSPTLAQSATTKPDSQ
jgi:predicted peptidase